MNTLNQQRLVGEICLLSIALASRRGEAHNIVKIPHLSIIMLSALINDDKAIHKMTLPMPKGMSKSMNKIAVAGNQDLAVAAIRRLSVIDMSGTTGNRTRFGDIEPTWSRS